MLRFLWLVPGVLLLSVGCGDSTGASGCVEDGEPREACESFDVTSRRCESFLEIEFLPGDLGELCECQLQGVSEFPDCETEWEALHACLGALSCEEYIAFSNGEEDAPCLDAIERTSEACVDDDGRPIIN